MSRFIDLDGCYNFRDLGGYRSADGRQVRTGHLYRSDALHHLTDRDVERVRDELGLRHVVDLRSPHEVELEAPSPLAAPPVHYHHVWLFGGSASEERRAPPGSLGDLYFAMMQHACDRLALVVEVLAGAEDPVVFHCAAGKDRTGVTAALVLGLLGVPDDTIVEDYVHSTRNLERIVERLNESKSYAGVFQELPPDTLHAEAETMRGLLDRTRSEHGSMRGYAAFAGIPEATIARLEEALLEAE